MKKLELNLFSGGKITIDRKLCFECETKACIRNCVSSTFEPVLAIVNGVPALSDANKKPETGWCIECLACELDCNLHGRKAIHSTFKETQELDRGRTR